MVRLNRTKQLFIICATVALFAGLLAANELNQPAEKVQSVETRSLSADGIITAFTFLLAALTLMATLFGVFIGYTGWKSAREYEKEVAKAQEAAKRAETAAKEAEATVLEIKNKGKEAIKDIGKLQRIIAEQSIPGVQEKDSLEQNLRAVLKKTDKSYEPVQDIQIKEKLAKLRNQAKDSIKKNDPEQAVVYLQEMISLDQDDAIILHALSLVLLVLQRYDEALEKISTSIQKDPKRGSAYFTRVNVLLSWHEKGGPKPNKESIIADLKLAKKFGHVLTLNDKKLFFDLLSDDEYKESIGSYKDEDKSMVHEMFVIRQKTVKILDGVVAKLDTGDNEGALGLIEASIILNEENPTLWLTLGFVLSELKRYEQAIEKITVALKKNSNLGFAYFIRSYIKLKWLQGGGPTPSKDEIVADVKAAAKYGYGPKEYDEKDKALFTGFLGEYEYSKLVASLQEETK